MKPKDSKRLWAAVLDQAIKDAIGGNLYLRKEAQEWFCSKSREVGSFLWICSTLGIDPEFLQKVFRQEAS